MEQEKNHLVLKRARVPLRICLKLALKNMWKKKFRYLIMLIICALSLTFLAFTIELNGDKLKENIYTTVLNGYKFTDIYQYVEATDEEIAEDEYNKYAHTNLVGHNYDTIKKEVPNITLHEYTNVNICYAPLDVENANYFYTGYINTLIKYDNSNNYDLICGRLPKEGTKEVLITDYLVAAFKYFNTYPNADTVYDLLNQHIDLYRNDDYIIVGIIRTNYDKWTKFSNIETVEVDDKENYSYTYDSIFFNSVILNEIYFNIEKIGDSKVLAFNNRANGAQNSLGKWRVEVVNKSLVPEGSDGYYESSSTIGLTTDNLSISRSSSRSYSGTYYVYYGRAPENSDEITIPYTWISSLYGFNWRIMDNTSVDWEQRRAHRNFFDSINGTTIKLTLTSRDEGISTYEKEYKIVGINYAAVPVAGVANSRACQIVDEEFQSIYYHFATNNENILVELPTKPQQAETLFKDALKAGYVIDVFAYQSDIDSYVVDPFVNLMSKAGLFIFAAFTMGLMWTIISIEIVDSKKEIGILRSIGLSGGKVSFIFVIQTASMIFLSYFIGVYAAYKLIPIYNSGIMDEYNKITLYMYTFSYRTPIYLAVFVITMVTISTVIPLFKIMSHKIIDVINERDV